MKQKTIINTNFKNYDVGKDSFNLLKVVDNKAKNYYDRKLNY